jgi:pilus assembly protein Flp/PilA
MKNLFLKLSVTLELLKDALQNEQGQDLIEYALVVAFIAFAATAGMHTLAGSINAAFVSIGSQLTTAIA